MKKKYTNPSAEKVEFDYTDSVVASTFYCPALGCKHTESTQQQTDVTGGSEYYAKGWGADQGGWGEQQGGWGEQQGGWGAGGGWGSN